MKLLPVVVLNLVTVALALVAYDVLRAGPAPADGPPEESAADVAALDVDALDERLRALESDRRRVRRTADTSPDVLARLAALEAALRRPPGTDRPEGEEPGRGVEGPRAAPETPPAGEPSSAEIARFRQLQDAVRREDAVEKLRPRIDAALDGLPLNLTDEEREGVHRAYAAFLPRVDEIWGEAKTEARRTVEAGGQVDKATLVEDATAAIRREFAETLGSVVPRAESVTIAEALMPSGK